MLKKSSSSLILVLVLVLAQLIPVGLFPMRKADASPAVNLALNKTASASSGTAKNAFDGSISTLWQPSMADRQDNMNVWLSVNLGAKQAFTQVIFDLNRGDNIQEYRIMYSNDGTTWSQAYAKNKGITTSEVAAFPEIIAQYVKLDITLSKDLSVQVKEVSVYNIPSLPQPPADLQRIYFTNDAGQEYPINSELRMNKDDIKSLAVKGVLASGTVINMDSYAKSIKASTTDVTIDIEGKLKAEQVGAAIVQAATTVGSVTMMTPDFWVVVDDPSEKNSEAFSVVNTTLTHPSMTMELGRPAIIAPGDIYPTASIQSNVYGKVSGEVIFNGTTPVAQLAVTPLVKGETVTWTPTGTVPQSGLYEIRLKIEQTGKDPVYDSFQFTGMRADSIPAGQSLAAFLGAEGRMVYVGDFRGNRILDFSNVGYMGGGVKIPDIRAKVVIEPAAGDATARIQAAIDQVSQMPLGTDGFRGAVLLKKGRYDVAGTLTIRMGGIVLRGEGDKEDGTLIYGSGKIARTLIDIGKGTGAVVDTASTKPITDLYVPAGARSFHVSDASAYHAGNKVMVRRVGNDRWIHEIGMDYIYNRPNAGATQWSAFNLDFDREITAVNGNTITVDAPIGNAIDSRWGGGTLSKYNDDGRIQQVGVENMRVDSEFDPSIINTVMDNELTDPYYADENHAERFVLFNSVKNGWVRNVTGYHLSYSLVEMGASSKWITVQDCSMYDMVSIITGGRRYAFFFKGQQNLVQRTYVETPRHAYVYDSRVPGPNVVVDGESQKNYNTSEPHHRWSVGGLFDNVKAPISIRDRQWLGSGHGWAGANYVTWNTEGDLTNQQPPTATNYSIGHVGTKAPGLVPSDYDARPRKDAYWDHLGEHVGPVSLYKQQLADRLGQQAVQNIQAYPVGGGLLDEIN